MKSSVSSKMVVLLCIVTLLMSMFSFSAVIAASEPTISMNDVNAVPGSLASLSLSVENATGMVGFQVTLNYDKNLITPVKQTVGAEQLVAAPSDYLKQLQSEAFRGLVNYVVDNSEEGKISIIITTPYGVVSNNDLTALFDIKFQVNSKVAPGTKIPVNVTVDRAEKFVESSIDDTVLFTPATVNGSITTNYTYSRADSLTTVSVPFGASVSDLLRNLAQEVNVYATDGTVFTATIEWDTSSYNPRSSTLQTITGKLILPAGILTANGVAPTIEGTVRVLAQDDDDDDDDGGGGSWSPGGTVINYDQHNAYMNGYVDGSFQPDGNITRAEVAAVIHRIRVQAGMTDPGVDNSNPTFRDVDSSHWAFKDIEVLAKLGILAGDGDGTFRPSDPITRAEYAKVIAVYKNLSVTGLVSPFEDCNGHWGNPYIAAVNAKGYVIGYVDGSYRPQNRITRAEVATATNRVLERNFNTSKIDQVCKNPYWDVTKEHWAYYHIMEASVSHTFNNVNGQENWYKLV